MLKIDRGLLDDLGLGALDPDKAETLLRFFHSTLERRVGLRIASQLSEEQLDEFEALLDDEVAALAWLERTCPDHRAIVAAEFEALKRDIGARASAVLRAAC